MRKVIVCAFLLLSAFVSFGRIFRIGFADVPAIPGQDYATFYLAYPEMGNGDTAYVFPGSNLGTGWPVISSVAQVSITKQLTIISKGNWLDSSRNVRGNFELQASKGTAFFNKCRVIFKPGSEGSTITGFEGGGDAIEIQTRKITVKRNYDFLVYFGSTSVDSLIIEGNYRVWFDGDDEISDRYKNIFIRNNFIFQFLLPVKTYTGVIENNTWAWDQSTSANGGSLTLAFYNSNCDSNNPGCGLSRINLQEGTWLFQNNLLVSVYSSDPSLSRNIFSITNAQNSIFNYNVALSSTNFTAWPGTGTGNVFIPFAEAANIFEGFPAIGNYSADNRYMLKANSPAGVNRVAGATVEAGMFGGLTPYKLSTIPSIPTIYKISSPDGNTPTGPTLRIDISTRSNN